MNHLAHLLLAGPGRGDRLGALLGDHVKGRAALAGFPADIAQGIVLHRRIDGWSDRHPAVGALLARLRPPFRRYGGVILDVLFDHMLTRHWERFAGVPLPAFADAVDALLWSERLWLPQRLQRFALWARMSGLWTRYGERELLQEIFTRLGRRHGRPGPLASGLDVLEAHETAIETGFLMLFPDLLRQADAHREKRARTGSDSI